MSVVVTLLEQETDRRMLLSIAILIQALCRRTPQVSEARQNDLPPPCHHPSQYPILVVRVTQGAEPPRDEGWHAGITCT